MGANLANAGNVETSTPITVTFFLSQPTPIALDRTIIETLGSCGAQQTATGLLRNLSREDNPQVFVHVESNSGTVQSPVMTLREDVRIKKTWAPHVCTVPDGPVTGTLYATIVNKGAIGTSTPVTVTFYLQETATMLIGQVNITPPLDPQESETVAVLWSNLQAGTYPYCVTAQFSNTDLGPECGVLIVNPCTYMPAIFKSY